MVNLTIFKNFIINYKQESLSEIFDAIKGGRFAGEIAKIRQSYAKGDKEGASELKKALLAFAPSARFDGERKIESITQYTGLIVLDFDNLSDDQLDNALAAVKKDPFTTMAFISPSGRGFKALVKVDTGLKYHKRAFLAVVQYFEDLTGCKVDPSGKDPARLCFLSYDPEAYLNESSQTFHVEIADEQVVQARSVSPGQHGEDIYEKLKDFTDNKATYVVGNRNNYIHQLACNANRWGVAEADIQKWVVNDLSFSDLGSEEKYDTVRSAYRNNKSEHGRFCHFADLPIMPFHATGGGGSYSDDFYLTLSRTPYLPEGIYDVLPKFIKTCCSPIKDRRERDVALLSILTSIGPCFPGLRASMMGRYIHSNLFLFVAAPPASGKSMAGYASKVVDSVHKSLAKETKQNLAAWKTACRLAKANKQPEPPKPLSKYYVIPADVSAALFKKILEDNDGVGLIKETEADILTKTSKREWGDFLAELRDSWGNETISWGRMIKDDELGDVPLPIISLNLCGTPMQAVRLLPWSEDGLVSRFMFYIFNDGVRWKSVSEYEENGVNYIDLFTDKGNELKKMYDRCKGMDTFVTTPMRFLTTIDAVFSELLSRTHIFNQGAESLPKRFSVMVIKIASLLRWLDEMELILSQGLELPEKLEMDEKNFRIAMQIVLTLFEHSMAVFRFLPDQDRSTPKVRADLAELFERLPVEFSTQEALEMGTRMGISKDRVAKLLSNIVLHNVVVRKAQGMYRKTNK